MTACHRCGFPDLAQPIWIDGHAYGPDCALELETHKARGTVETPGMFSRRCKTYPMRSMICPRCGGMERGDSPKAQREAQRRHRCVA